MDYFKDDEFYCKCTRATCDAKGNPPDPLLRIKLNELRHALNKPIIINSGWRCREHNAASGGTIESEHLTGGGVDISCTNSSDRWFIVRCAFEVGFTRIGIAKSFVHVGVDASKPQRVVWLY